MEIEKMVQYYLDKTNTPTPIHKEDVERLLTRMVNCGIITKNEADVYVEERKRNDKGGSSK